MRMYIVISSDHNNGALVTLKPDGLQEVHPFIFPIDVLIKCCYYLLHVPFNDLPAELQATDFLPFSNDSGNLWYFITEKI